jgi:predicted DCC family thiol-disulfide oxidoreductase YuxK
MSPGDWIAYDGDCPFCSAYVSLIRLRDAVGPVELLNIRISPEVATELTEQGFDLDKGMVLKLNGEYFYGEDCVHRLALLSTSSGIFNSINAFVFRHKVASALLYPVLKAGRRMALMLLGREKIHNHSAQ